MTSKIASLMILALVLISHAAADSAVFKFLEDPDLDAALVFARQRFMETRPGTPPDRLDSALLVRELVRNSLVPTLFAYKNECRVTHLERHGDVGHSMPTNLRIRHPV
jgi:hypothetical protein